MKEKYLKRILGQLDQLAKESGITIKSLTASTLEDALTIVRERFPVEAVAQVSNAIRCPTTCGYAGKFGVIAYENGIPSCFQAAVLREAYLGRDKFYVTVPGCFCTSRKSSPLSVLLVARETQSLHLDAKMIFGNTLCLDAINVDRPFGFDNPGPGSCEHKRFAVIRWPSVIAFAIRRKLLKLGMPKWTETHDARYRHVCGEFVISSATAIDERFDAFWTRYRANNKGLVFARDGAILQWVFGDRLVRRELVVLTAESNNELVGYVIFKPVVLPSRKWMILDVIAFDNDAEILDLLLSEAKRYLRKSSNAITLEILGLNEAAQWSIRRQLPFKQQLVNNNFLYRFLEAGLKLKVSWDLMNSADSWFFGPYDGDMCM